MISGFTWDMPLTRDSAKGGFHGIAQKKLHENKSVHNGETVSQYSLQRQRKKSNYFLTKRVSFRTIFTESLRLEKLI